MTLKELLDMLEDEINNTSDERGLWAGAARINALALLEELRERVDRACTKWPGFASVLDRGL